MNIIEIITSVGFPIACCIALAWYIYKRDEKHEEEISKLRESIDKNSDVIQELIYYLKETRK